MKRNCRSTIASLLAVSAFLFCLTCTPAPTAGTATETENVAGILYQPDGITPAKGAKVYIVPTDHNPHQGLSALDSAITNDSGVYKMDSVPAGTYNILANGNGNRAYIDSITIKKDTITHVPADTLKAPGGLRGVIKLQPGDDARTVLILFMGTNVWGMPDDATGNFGVANMAEGKYRVRILTTLDTYIPKDTVLSVTAGKIDTLTKDIVLQYTGIPVVGGVKIEYDTMKQIVTLRWNKPATGRKVAGYNIYRKQQDSTSFVAIKNGVKDTVYSDSTGVQDLVYEYRVAAVDTMGTEGVKSEGVGVKMVGVFVFNRTFAAKGSSNGEVLDPLGLCTDVNGNLYVVDWSNFRIQEMDSSGKMLLKFGGQGSADSLFDSPYDVAVDSIGNIYITDNGAMKVKKFDSTGVLKKAWSINGYPTGILIIGNSRLFVTAGGFARIFTLNGDSISTLTIPYEVKRIVAFNDSTLFASCGDGKMRQYSVQGVLQNTWTIQGALQGCRFTITDTGEIFAATGYDLNCISIFDTKGRLISRFGNSGANVGSLNYPKDILIIGKNIYISDNNGIQLFNKR